MKINSFSNVFYINKKLYLILKENKKTFVKKKRGFIGTDFVKTCHKHLTGKSLSDALILESVNPQYDKRLFIEFLKKYKFTT